MPERKLPGIGERVRVEGWDGEFIVVDVNYETHSASLLPADNGAIVEVKVETVRARLRGLMEGAGARDRRGFVFGLRGLCRIAAAEYTGGNPERRESAALFRVLAPSGCRASPRGQR